MNKCRNIKVKTSDGVVHDSIKELRRWKELTLLERAGYIKDLQRQVKFVLIPSQYEQGTIGKRGAIKKGKLIERELSYIADFVYTDTKTGEMVVEDAKGYKGGTVYALFVIKRKLMLYIHNIQVKEV
jgi:hypothetical protein